MLLNKFVIGWVQISLYMYGRVLESWVPARVDRAMLSHLSWVIKQALIIPNFILWLVDVGYAL
ncbi:hypothetical protein TorRG33x02_246730 [Trema orientale]|uniref:Uncharacterized protein n=1 Tax=Trema orientale TaxID=63057 RepID=A0A2P5DMY7_TREOI|nr:hypothetical protein TorRG33x02_246730 [Trema orientale]